MNLRLLLNSFFSILILLLFVFSPFVVHAEYTPEEAAILARRLVAKTGMGELATVFKSQSYQGLDGHPFNSQEYLADACPSTGEPLLALVSWGIHAANAKQNSKVSVSYTDMSWYKHPYPSRGPMDRPRLILVGKLNLSENQTEGWSCFLEKHSDARGWKFAHSFQTWKLSVDAVRWVGGYGDVHYVGWIPKQTYFDTDAGLEEEKTNHRRRQLPFMSQ